MSLKILSTQSSDETFIAIYDFIEIRFGKKSADKFLEKAENVVALIAEHPFMYKGTSIDNNVRIAAISKQTSLFYRVTETSVHLLYFWDNRRDQLFL
ncbi:type II toxin-antitoxin system RelE/ParE family toxin [Mucilaginibacter sp. SMC90]|uniref:type II toxin-antitoxin system RelE/ParE family toxin n=1 Tax=Mucilaginibacter sp. SMC90 TaxID=2929803 RepID=UPI001FB31C14|nr:type II toxin-antitoxin system RelE/ParE family toxin [Mucilaginibacter sp. SMC90]UOE48561.1 type II toxin-antitoxin system RelE/ParE family toxin [Mucilaginibacter sp. SMC90]